MAWERLPAHVIAGVVVGGGASKSDSRGVVKQILNLRQLLDEKRLGVLAMPF